MMKYFIFDVDGTLLDSDRTIVRCLTNSAKEFGYKIKEVKDNIGVKKLEEILEINGVNKSDIKKIIETYKMCYESTFKIDTTPVEGSYEVLSKLKEYNKLGIITFKYYNLTKMLLNEFFKGIEFDYIFCGDFPFPLREKSDALNIILKEAGDPQSIFYIGDRKSDMESAFKVGVKSVWASYGLGSHDGEFRYDYKIDSFQELLRIESI